MNGKEVNVIATVDGENASAVYLCQVSERVSCGACCGLYNVADLSRDALEDRLARRTERFAAVTRSEDGIEKFRCEIEGWTPEDRPFPHFHHCPFLGLIGETRGRVGCLLHPAAPGNDGYDLRFMSYYGAKACRSYFCPSTQSLPAQYLYILRALWDDWYEYGLIITEHRLLNAVFTLLENRIARPVVQDDFPVHSEASHCLRKLLALKLSWPYRRAGSPGPCHFLFDNGLYPRKEVQWPVVVRPDVRYDIIFRELESHFGSERDVVQATALLDDVFGGLSDALW
ncbi:MAG: hypothetical protein V2J65_18105 [Desulfobacteraceae bacterium]|jgi:hypothetical protein|nr:hypothetical protein [Desulfobacteraceae bacterium]